MCHLKFRSMGNLQDKIAAAKAVFVPNAAKLVRLHNEDMITNPVQAANIEICEAKTIRSTKRSRQKGSISWRIYNSLIALAYQSRPNCDLQVRNFESYNNYYYAHVLMYVLSNTHTFQFISLAVSNKSNHPENKIHSLKSMKRKPLVYFSQFQTFSTQNTY